MPTEELLQALSHRGMTRKLPSDFRSHSSSAYKKQRLDGDGNFVSSHQYTLGQSSDKRAGDGLFVYSDDSADEVIVPGQSQSARPRSEVCSKSQKREWASVFIPCVHRAPVEQNSKGTSLAIRKRYVLGHPQEFRKQIEQIVESHYRLLDSPRSSLSCWLYPHPPHVKGKPTGAISKNLSYFDQSKNRQIVTMNVGMMVLILAGRVSEEQSKGFIEESWHLSHRCGNWTCLNPLHMTVEPGPVNQRRNRCMNSNASCSDKPKCLSYLKLKCCQLPGIQRSETIFHAAGGFNIRKTITPRIEKPIHENIIGTQIDDALNQLEVQRLEFQKRLGEPLPDWIISEIDQAMEQVEIYASKHQKESKQGHVRGRIPPPEQWAKSACRAYAAVAALQFLTFSICFDRCYKMQAWEPWFSTKTVVPFYEFLLL